MQEKINQFKKKIQTQKGGAKAKKGKTTKKKDDDEFLDTDDVFSDIDDELDDSSDNNTKRVQRYVPNTTFPIYHWYYDPYVYRLNSVFVPTFYSYVTPYIELSLR